MATDRRGFCDCLRKTLFRGHLTTAQLKGLEAILDGWEALPETARAKAGGDDALAYILATAFHETAATMQPVRETLAPSDEEAVRRLDRAFAAGRLASVKTPYWRYDADGRTWLGRGFLQLTHRKNYQAMSALTGIDLVADPARAMELHTTVAILIGGMRAGSFTGKSLADYFSGGRADFASARKIINGTDRAALVASYARTFRAALGAGLSPEHGNEYQSAH
ncbi:hypothetical protein [Neorhizobium sp. NCHU2750]|uniref:hypothetical protein n=1 Tax=Neorhizobium sp. NCHU2750 TaxID=1825976 RepID=UPI000E75DC8D|nr:chitinase [Neorhizobium sp. NCHU2750]